MDLNRIYDYMTGRPDTYKGLKGVGYEDFEKNMGDARYRRNIYNQLYINGGINSKYDAFDSSWEKTYGEEDFSRYEAEQNPTSTMDTYDYEQMRIDPEREEKRINALRDELDSEGVTPESVYAGIEAGLADVEKNYGEALRRRNEARDSSPTPIVTGPAYFRMEGMYDNSPEARAVANYGLAKELYGKAGNMMDASFKGSGLLRGIKDTALDWDTWTSGLTKMVNDWQLDRLYKKVENGETLAADEGRLLDAATYYTLAGTLQQLSSPSVAYSIGKGFTESVPYMIEFALTYGPASSVTRGLARAVSKKLGRNVSNKIAKSGVKVLAEGTKAAATGAVQTPMSFGRIAADTRERMMGDPQVGVDKEGKPVFLGRGEGDDFWTALGKSVGAQYITNISEVSGVIPVKVFRFLSKPAQGAIRKLTDSKYIKSIRESDFVKGARAFGKPFKIGSAPEELFEEYFEGTLNASMIGDTDLESLYSWRSLSEIAGVVLLTQAVMGGLGMVENNRFKGRLVREYGRAEESFSRAVPDKDERDLIATYMNLNMNRTEGATPFDVLARQAAEAAVNRHANDFMREDGSFDTAAAEKYRADVTKAISGYFTVKPLYDAYLSGITGRKKQDEERIREEIAGKAAGESGQIITVILPDGRRARVTGGHVVPTPDGRIDVEKTGDHFTAVYEDDGTAVQLPADESYRLEVVGVEDAVQAAVGANNEMIVRDEEEAVYGPRPQIGELVYVRDSEGNPVALAVGSEVDENGNFTAVATRDYDDKVKDFPVTVNMSEIVREEQPSGGNEGVDEYQTFVDTGTVSDDVVSRIANKIAAGESLTPEEESMRQGASERVEGSLRQIKETQSVLSRIPKDEKGNPVYEQADPEQAAERIFENIQSEYPYLAQDDVEVFNEMLDVLRYDSAKDMVSEAEEMHRRNDTSYEAYDKDQAMYDTAMQERDEILEAENEAYRRELESQGKQVSENEEEKERYRESGDSSSAAGTSDRNDGGVDETSLQREVRKFGERMAERLGGGIRFVYARDIPESEANYKKKREAYGYYDTATGEVVVVLDNHTSKGVPSVIEVAKTVMHEVVGHKGVRGLLGEEGDAFFDDVYRGMKARSKAELESKYGGQLTRRVGESEADFETRRRRLIADEYIAQIAERGNNPGLLRRVIAKIREVLRGLGVDLAMTDNDIRNVLRRSTRELTRRKNAELNVENDIRYRESARKEYQLEVINRYNPMLDDVHTGIRSVEDIQSFEEMYEQAKKDYEEYGDMVYPDMDMNMLKSALETGYIRVYSSNRISPGVFVTPSRMNAEDYSGGGDVYSELVPVNDVAWIDQSEGQYIGGEIRYREGIKNPPKENTQPPGTIASQSMDVAKVIKEEEKRQTAKKNLLELGKSFRGRKSGIGTISDIAKAIGARGNGASKYAYFTLPDNTIFSVRISNHNANAETYKERGEEKGVNTSIVIKTRRKGNRFKSSPGVNLSEFVYMREDIAQSDGDVLSQIAESLADMMETGYYEDKTGLARINISGNDDIRYRAAEADYNGVQEDAEREYESALDAPMDFSVAEMMPIEAARNAETTRILRDMVQRFPDTKIAITDISRIFAAADVGHTEGAESTSGLRDVAGGPSAPGGVRDDMRYRQGVNERFNDELQQQIDGTLPKGHVYGLGRPSEVLLAAGIPDLPIELAASRLGLKASAEYESNHPFELGAVMNLPEAIQHPIAVFDSKTRVGSKVILVELKDRNGNNFVVAMNTNVPKSRYSKASIQINDIRSIYPKDNVLDIVNWINRGDLLRYADKKKIEDWITQQRSNSAEVEIQNLDVAANIVENFENPKVGGENARYRIKGLRFDESNAPHYDTDIRGRDRGSFKESAGRVAERAAISLFDEQLKLKQLQNRVTEWLTGSKTGDLPDGLRFYDAENQAGSIAKDRKMRFDNEYKSRLFELRMEAYKALGNKVDDKYYYYAKTLNERIGVIGEKKMAANKATMFSHLLVEKNRGHKFPKGFTDPKIYPYEALQDYAREQGRKESARKGSWIDSIEGYIADCENRMGDKLVNDIWGVIGEISEYELTTSFKNGLITRDHYDILMYGQKLSEIVKGNLAAGKITEAQYNAFLSLDLTAEELHKAGFLTDEQFEGLKRRYAYYLPLKGDSEPSSEDKGDYEGRHSRVPWRIKDVKGGNTRLVNDPISRLLADVYASISYQEKMSWIQSMYQALRLAERRGNGAGDFAILNNWVVKDEEGNYVPYSRNVDGNPVFTPTEGEIASGEVVKAKALPVGTEIRIPEALQGEHLVRVKHRGRSITVYFRDPGVARAVNDHFVPRKTNGAMRIFRKMGRFMASAFTSHNPAFVFSNLFKDFGEAASNNYIQYGASYLAAYTKNYGRVMSHPRILMQAAGRTLRAETPYEKMVEEFFKYGGEVSYTQMESYEKTLKDFEKELRRSADKNGVLRIGKRSFSKIGEAISGMNKIVELNARVATFITSREMGYGLRQSIRDAKEVTVNFDRRGKSSRGFGTYFLFWNAGRQSNRRKWELMREHPGRFWASRAAMWTFAAAKPFMFGMLVSALSGVDWEEYMSAYFDIPDFIRYRNMVFMSSDGKVFRVPTSPSFVPGLTLAENLSEMVYRTLFNDKDGKYDLSKGVGDILKSLSADLGDPINWDAPGAKKLVGLAPAPFTGLAELIGNVDFTGRPIYREGNSTSPGYKNVYSRTKDFYVDAGRWLNELSGGEPSYGKGLGHINPAMVEHYVESWVGGAGDFVVKMFGVGKSAWNVLSGESVPFMGGRYEQIPFVGTFYAGDSGMLGEREVRNDIYEARKIVKKYNDTKSNFVKTDEDAENNPRTSRYLDRNESKIDDLKDLLKLYDEITEELKDEDSEEYRERLKMLRRDIVELTNELEEY